MPQMAPITWLTLYFFFSIIFLIFNIMNFYSFIPPMPKSNNMKMNFLNSLNWKW